MSEQFQDVQYRRDDVDSSSFFYIPGAPSPELTPAGVPAANLISTGNGGFLQLGVRWDLTQSQAKELQDHLRKQFPDLTTAPILRPEPITVDKVNLLMQMPDRSSSVLATSSSSGFPPFAALFNMMLDGARFAQATMAFSGRKNVLKVQYEITAQSKTSCTATVAGDVRADVRELDADADLATCRSRIDSAIAGGRVRLATTGDDVSAELLDKTIVAAKERAAGTLKRMLTGADSDLDTAHLLASVTLSEDHPLKLIREADVGRWFSRSNVNLVIAATPG